MSRIELSALANVGKTVIYDIEHAKDTVRLRSILNVLEALNVSLSFQSPLMDTFFYEHQQEDEDEAR